MKLDLRNIEKFADPTRFADNAIEQNRILHNKSGAGNNFLGWVNLPETIQKDLPEISAVGEEFRDRLDCLVIIGIGGSYLGAKAVISALRQHLPTPEENPEVLFAGHHLDQQYHQQLLRYLTDKNWGIIVISKSGTTTEPAIAFRLLRNALIKQFGTPASKKRIITITDQNKGALRTLTDAEGYQSFNIPDDVGGRFSVLTPVGLVPIAAAGIDIRQLVSGAISGMEKSGLNVPFSDNPAARYAAARYALYSKGKCIEILSNFNPAVHYISEWWKQLFGESEGKEGKGIFPAAVDLTTDLHSMGQYIQDGQRQIFETCVLISESGKDLYLPGQDNDLDELNYLQEKSLSFINRQAAEGTILAHHDGGVPVIRIEMEELTPHSIGELFYFFEKACGISGYLLGVNPFDQPGVEAYKKNMFALLGKKGFEEETRIIRSRIPGSSNE